MSSVSIGNRAETAAAEFLVRNGYEILQRNYRKKHCEIDIVAVNNSCVHFVEVKYRATSAFGNGLEYITNQKIAHMRRAAETWLQEHSWSDECVLSAIEVTGAEYEVTAFLETL